MNPLCVVVDNIALMQVVYMESCQRGKGRRGGTDEGDPDIPMYAPNASI